MSRLVAAGGRMAVVRQWPALLRDGVADIFPTRRVSKRDTLTRRATDLLVAGLLALPALLMVGALAILVRVVMGAPAFVTVDYRGRQGRPLRLRKLRTMTNATPARVTRLGTVLRSTRLDELPALAALARGDVTVFGPPAQSPTSAEPAMPMRPGLIGRHHSTN